MPGGLKISCKFVINKQPDSSKGLSFNVPTHSYDNHILCSTFILPTLIEFSYLTTQLP